MIYYQDNHIQLFNKDCRDMSELPGESVQMVVTSPPYWGLRKYSGEQELIWGDKDCQHEWIDSSIPKSGGVGDYEVGRVGNARARSDSHDKKESSTCSLCGAWKGSYGLEPTPEMYIQHTIEILREIRRVLRKDGVVFWNIGDSYAGSGRTEESVKYAGYKVSGAYDNGAMPQRVPSGLKPKDLCLIPFRVAIAAQEDGWWVRSVIIWSKPNPMPESVTDRPTESHEYILMLTKSGTTQYWTHRDGNREATNPDYRWVKDEIEVDEMPDGWTPKHKMDWNRLNLWRGHDYYWDADAVREPLSYEDRRGNQRIKYDGKGVNAESGHSLQADYCGQNPAGRNIRTVWEFPTQPYPEAHFAVFPEKLPEICIKASTPEVGCCSKCGSPWERITETQYTKPRGDSIIGGQKGTDESNQWGGYPVLNKQVETLGWQPTCKCNAEKVPSIVLDPFAGAGTTLWVAKKLNRKAIGYEISEEYCQLAVERMRQQVMM